MMKNIDKDVLKVISVLDKIPTYYHEVSQRVPYYNMAATLTDAVLQAGMNYKNVVYPRICNILTKYEDYKTTCDFIILFQTIPIQKIINWKNVSKQQSICELAWVLYEQKVENEDDLAHWIHNESNQERLLSIKGIGYKTVDYLKLLSGQEAIPIDRHMFRFLDMANVVVSGYKEASRVLCNVAKMLKISESALDKIIWEYMSNNDIKQLNIQDVFGVELI